MKRYAQCGLFLLLILFGCETDRVLFKGPYFVRFTKDSDGDKESHSKPVGVEIHLGGPALDKDMDIAYQLTGDARYGIDYTIVGEPGHVTLTKGQYFTNIEIQLINNANNILRSQEIVFTLKTVNVGGVQIGQGESAIGQTFTFTISDDCILGGDFIGTRGTAEVDNVTITSTDCENYTVSNWNVGVFTISDPMALKFFDNGDNTLLIPSQEQPELPTDLATIHGTGVVDPVTREIILTITLDDFDNQPQVTVHFTPN